jgi:anhydro-N-acetylmuramic acid kinase
MTEKKLLICGVMTGTSCDGIDFATIDFNEEGWTPIWEASREYPKNLRDRVLRIQNPGTKTTLKEVFELNRDLGIFYAEAVAKTLSALEPEEQPQVIALHGQTVGHFPSEKPGFTVQLGDPSLIVQKTGLTVISHFREGDLTAGGQGAPLATPFHSLLADALDGVDTGVVVVNLGGIANFSYIGPKDQLIAADTGPACALIDRAVIEFTKGKKTFDEYGDYAREGKVHVPSLKKLLKHPYFKKKFPKTTGRDDFHWEYVKKNIDKKVKGKDLIATVSALTIESLFSGIKSAIIDKKLPLRSVYLAGGGSRNLFILEHLEELLAEYDVSVVSLDETEFSSQFIEAQAFSYLGFRTLLGMPVGGSYTGAKGFGAPGWITPGVNWSEVLERLPQA